MRWLVGLALVLAVAGCSASNDEPKSEASYGPLDSLDGDSTDSQSLPVLPDGMEFVGLGHVVVAVPEGLERDTRCGIPQKDPTESFCLRLRDDDGPALRRLTVTLAPDHLVPDFGFQGEPFTNAAGVKGTIGDACVGYCPAGLGSRVVIPSEQLVLVVSTAFKSNNTLVNSIVESVMLVPDGYTTVPAMPLGLDTEDAVTLLSDAGFKVDVPTPSPAYYFWDTTPAAGAVVEEGSTVTVHVGDG